MDIHKKCYQLFIIGAFLLLLGDITQYIFPINKNIWSSSFVLMVGGISIMGLNLVIYLTEIKNYSKYFKFAHIFGLNSIFSYVISGMLTVIFYSDSIIGISLNKWFMNLVENNSLSLKIFSFLYALFYAIIIWLPTKILFNKKIFIKL